MTDRELLKLAAKAAGIELVELDECQDVLPDGTAWNPLNDDGDALRLAVRLEIETTFRGSEVNAYTVIYTERLISENRVHDPCAATRRVIVRAAAEIGKAMP